MDRVIFIGFWILIFELVFIMAEPRNSPGLECKTRLNIYDDYKTFKRNEIDLPMKTAIVQILANSQDDCFVNLTRVKQEMHLPAANNSLGFVMHCLDPRRIRILEDNSERLDHVVASFQLVKCGLDVQGWNTLSAAFDTRVLLIMDNFFSANDSANDSSNVSVPDCSSLTKIGTFLFHYITVPNKEKRSFSYMFNCLEVFPFMAEVIFQNMSWTEMPSSMSEKFPNLQLLDLSNNNLTEPPENFPWTNEIFYLPKNLSRTTYMDSHYTKPFELLIPADIYRREFNLNFNQIKNLNGKSFHGFLHRISLKGNGLEFIGNNTFNMVEGLQSLDLSNNSIEHISCEVFSNLSQLRMLDLNLNNLTRIHQCLFQDLVSIRKLNLADNRITIIDAKAFIHMANLTKLSLENNQLTFFSGDAFPLESVHLKELYFQGNPLTVLPEFVFWFRKIEHVNLASTDISMEDFTDYLTNMDMNRVLHSLVLSASTSDLSDLLERRQSLRKIDLTSSKIDNLYLEKNSSDKIKRFLKILLLHYEFILTDNPIACDCRITGLQSIVNELHKEKKITFKDYYFSKWMCQSPKEYNGRQLMSVKAEETYCSIEIRNCPFECKCFKRSMNNNIIVDCRDLGLTEVHDTFPENVSLELWYSGNNISRIETNNTSLLNVLYLDLSFNRLQELPEEILESMENIKTLRLHSNLLSYLPLTIKTLSLKRLTISTNPLLCDCHSLWLKNWMKENKFIVSDWNMVSCTTDSEDSGHILLDVPDNEFVCKESSPPINYETVIIASATLLVILVIVCILGYTYRLECKVLLFVYFGLHPFDKDTEGKDEHIDCVIVHDGRDTDFVMQSIVKSLEDEEYNYVICDMERDFVLGFSLQENISRTVQHSKRIIFLLSNNWNPSSEGFAVAWGIAEEKIRESKSNFGIFVLHEICPKSIENESIQRFIKHGRFIGSNDKLFLKKVMYYLPDSESDVKRKINDNASVPKSFHRTEISKCFESNELNANNEGDISENEDSNDELKHAFISYADEDVGYVVNHLQPLLEQKGFNLIIQDRDFILGASKEENILRAIHSSRKTILVLSSSHCKDEWTLFTFRAAYEKSLREQYNHLLVLMIEDVQNDCIDEEMKHYLHKYICLNRSDKWFENKLLNGMPVLKYKQPLIRLSQASGEVSTQNGVASSEIDIRVSIIDDEVTKL